MCYDINPLGTAMYLKELDRRAARPAMFSPGRTPRPMVAGLVRVLRSLAVNPRADFFGVPSGQSRDQAGT